MKITWKRALMVATITIFSMQGSFVIAQDSENQMTSSAQTENNLPEEFEKLPGKYQFEVLVAEGKEYTTDYKAGYVNGEPMIVVFNEDGTITYQEEYLKENHIEKAEWNYIPEGRRSEDEPEINFTIKTYQKGGSYGTEKYTLVEVTDEHLVYENKALNMKFTFKRL